MVELEAEGRHLEGALAPGPPPSAGGGSAAAPPEPAADRLRSQGHTLTRPRRSSAKLLLATLALRRGYFRPSLPWPTVAFPPPGLQREGAQPRQGTRGATLESVRPARAPRSHSGLVHIHKQHQMHYLSRYQTLERVRGKKQRCEGNQTEG